MTLFWSAASSLPQISFGRLFRRLDRPVPDGAQIVTAYTDGQVTLRSNRAKIGYHEAADLSGFKGVEVGDLVVHGLDILRGSVGIADSAGAITAVCTVCEPVVDLDLRYVAHAIRVQARSGFMRALARGIREGGADFRRWGTLAELPIPMPPVEYQRTICDYLERETARIDKLVKEQRHLIELLRERRNGLVAKTFQTLRNDNRALKFSVDDVTVGIVVQPSRWYVDVGVPALRGINIKRGSISLLDLVNVSEEGHAAHPKSQLRPGDVVVVRTGQAGAAAKIPAELDRAHAIDVLLIKPGQAVDPDFLVWYLNSPVVTSRIEHGSVGALQGHFNVSALRELPYPEAPITEQRRIAAYLDEKIEKIDATIEETDRFIELARERRAALITAAVTGQIDVREMA